MPDNKDWKEQLINIYHLSSTPGTVISWVEREVVQPRDKIIQEKDRRIEELQQGNKVWRESNAENYESRRIVQ